METPKQDRAPQLADKYIVRMPDGMRARLIDLAKANNRSMNAEIVLILQQALDANDRQQQLAALDVDALADALADRLAVKLRGL